MKHSITGALPLLAGVLCLGCTEMSSGTSSRNSMSDEEIVRRAKMALEQMNTMTPNGLSGNGLTGNGLSGNGLSGNGLSGNGLSGNGLSGNGLTGNGLSGNGADPSVLTALQDPSSNGDLTRMFFRYLISCALDPSQSISFSWTDSSGNLHPEEYFGAIGLAPHWIDHAITPVSASWVSACLSARTNWYGTPVTISIRGSHAELNRSPAGEQTEFNILEGAFWGDLFDGTPQLYACHSTTDMGDSRARNRDCAAGHVNAGGTVESCGMIQILGDCEDYCTTMSNHGKYFVTCGTGDPGSHTNQVITIWLHE